MVSSDNKEYDYVILGAGCAGLSLLMRMLREEKLKDKKILLVDKEQKNKNDRTWCFWEKEKGFFEPIVLKEWKQLDFFSDSWSSPLQIEPYRYKMIRGADFYKYCFEEISKHPNVVVLYGELSGLQKAKVSNELSVDGHIINTKGATIFSSIYIPQEDKKLTRLLQHFKGWIIETHDDYFIPAKATLMDFRVSQQHGTSFVYVLPISPRSALVEYTLFTASLLEPDEYDFALKAYINEFLKIEDYRIAEQEFGIIPMTNERFDFNRAGIYNIGTAGGQTKASSGYTFQFIQKNSAKIVDCLVKGESLDTIQASPRRFRFYDNTLLEILYNNTLPGSEIFTTLFKKNNADSVLRFLDNESSLGEELKIISSLPTMPFLKAALKQF